MHQVRASPIRMAAFVIATKGALESIAPAGTSVAVQQSVAAGGGPKAALPERPAGLKARPTGTSRGAKGPPFANCVRDVRRRALRTGGMSG